MSIERNKIKVLIFPAGMENGIEIYESLKNCKDIELFAGTANVPNQTFYLYKNPIIIPDVRNENWVDELNKAIENHSIDLIFPANSLVIDELAKNRERIKTDILLPKDEILDVTRNKNKTIEILQDIIPCPKLFDDVNSILSFPVFAKPNNGYGAQGIDIIYSKSHLDGLDLSGKIIEEYLPGREFTIDCLSANGCLLYSNGRERSRIRMGTSMHAEQVSSELNLKFSEYAKLILKKIPIVGAWFFQMKEDINGELKLMEIDIRIAGTMCYDRCRGINFSYLSILLFYNRQFEVFTNQVNFSLDRCLKNRYKFEYFYKTVYIDLDDTIIVNSNINTDVIKFLYQCFNQNKRIVLITKNLKKELTQYLKENRISEIFDEIIWLREEDKKYEYIKDFCSIFIDDSFSQRLEVSKNCNIPTFDLSMLEVLFDDKY